MRAFRKAQVLQGSARNGTLLHQLYAVKLYGSDVRDGTSRCVRLLFLILEAFLVVVAMNLNVTVDGIEKQQS